MRQHLPPPANPPHMGQECPYAGDDVSSAPPCPVATRMNPDTQLPFAETLQQDTGAAAASLSTDREASSIPRDSASTWLYPSPRMFHNALLRKGHDTHPKDIEAMVGVHNFLNEQVWQEILQWETAHKTICGSVTLSRFMGRPRDLSPRARFWSLLGSPRPFDRHDWTVDRCGRSVRYVIDYYSGPRGEEGVFYVDVRPALDSWDALLDRTRRFWSTRWERLSETMTDLFRRRDA